MHKRNGTVVRILEPRGRAPRFEFFAVVIFYIVVLSMAAAIEDAIFTPPDDGELGPIAAAIDLALHIPLVIAIVRRLHDIDRTGWWALVPLASRELLKLAVDAPDYLWIALLPGAAGTVLSIVFLCAAGTRGPNRFGPDPIPQSAGTDHAPGAVSLSVGRAEPPFVTAPLATDLVAEIERLVALKERGALSDAEFEVMKTRAISRAGAS